MKYILIICLCVMTSVVIAQPTGDIEKDTALANQYFEQALGLIEKDDLTNQSIELLEKANQLYAVYAFDERLIEIKGLWAYQLALKRQRQEAEIIARTAMTLVKKNYSDTTNRHSFRFIYAAFNIIFYDRDWKHSVDYGLKAMALTKPNEPLYYDITRKVICKNSTLGNPETTDSLINKLEKLLDNQEDGDQYRMFLYEGRAYYYYELQNYQQSILYLQKVFSENEKYNLLSEHELSPLYLAVSRSYSYLKKLEEATTWMNKSISTSNIPESSPGYGIFLNELGMLHGMNRDFEKAITYGIQAIDKLLKDNITYREDLVMSYFNLTNFYISNNQPYEAEKVVKESLKYKNDFPQNIMLGIVLERQKKYKESVYYLHQALLQVSTNFSNPDVLTNPSPYEVYKHRIVTYIFSYKGRCLYEWGKQEKNQTYMEIALETLEYDIQLRKKAWQEAKGFEQSKFKINLRLVIAMNEMIYQQYGIYHNNSSEKHFEKFFSLSENRKAIQLVETLSPSHLPKSFYIEEQNLVKDLQQKGQQLDLVKARQEEDSISYYQDLLFEAGHNMEIFHKRMKQQFPKEADEFHNMNYATVQEIQNKLSPETLFVSYNLVQTLNTTYGIVVSNSAKNIYKIDIKTIDEKIKKLNELIQDPFAFQNGVRDEFINISHELYNQFIKPIESELEGKTELMIVVEGQLFHLPFELLLKSNEKKPYHELDFLIKNYAINYHYSATVFLKLQEKETVKDHSLLAFAPVFSKGEELNEATRSLDFLIDSLYNGIDGNKFIALPSTKKEVNTIAKIVKSNNGQANILLQKNATKTNFAQQLEKQSYQFIHIATHGLVNFKNPKLSALACYSKDETMDNLMYANEIQFQNINADLVILSSCESGIGQLVEGEGLIALNRSFIYSGAKNVMFSLWKVSDKYSSELMIDFYENYFNNQSYTVALRNAKLKMLSNPVSAQPKFWSAFVLMGE